MRTAEWINLLFFSWFIALAWLRPIAKQQQKNATRFGAVGIGLTLMTLWLQNILPSVPVTVVRDWLPAPLMLVVYWQVGQFVGQPNQKFQSLLQRLDEKMFGAGLRSETTSRLQLSITSYLELAYLLCYPLVPLGIGVLYLAGKQGNVDTYWAVVLPSTYLGYLLLPFMQALPPRMVHSGQGRNVLPSQIRQVNLWLLRHGSIQVITFPSAHVASTMAASLVLLRFVPLAGLVFLCIAISITAGTVVGRYHYAADGLLATVVAIVMFLLITTCFP